jgi:Ca2+-transporting ATPase
MVTVDPRGLTRAEAEARLAADGPNELPRPDRRTPLRILLDVIREPMFGLLLAGGLVYLLLGDLVEALVLLGFALASTSIAVVQEFRSERVLEALRELTSPRALVVRDGGRVRIPGREVVRGDLLVLSEGDRVPADALVRTGNDLAADESLLTGEAVPVRKTVAGGLVPPARPGGDDRPHVFAGSMIVQGQGVAEVFATGARSEIGRIGQALGTIEAEPPRLQLQTRRFVRGFALIGISASALAILLYGIWRGSWLEGLLAGIALGMSMLPEEFPLVLTVFMVMGAWRISRARVLTRRAAAIETLGAATVLCTDKTGTLTQNRMAIREIRAGDVAWRPDGGDAAPPAAAAALAHGILASAPQPFDPMEKAFHAMADAATPLPADRRLVRQYGLRPELLAVTQVWEQAGEADLLVAAKGAPEAVARLCNLDDDARRALTGDVDDMARQGIRVLGVAAASHLAGSALHDAPGAFGPFRFLGLVGLADPLRPGVPEAVAECRGAGIRVVMITGDYPATARAIAAEAGIDAGGVLSGDEIAALDDAALAAAVRAANVFARVMPEQKLRIVEALKANDEIVAMTGDGVNDAPSLKAAHIGIAMGGRGTDVAREAASLVLLDDDFGSIVTAIRLGRRIYDNLRKAMGYILAIHVPIAGLALMPLALGMPIILMPVHIAFLEMVIDPVCSVVFEAEAAEGDVMRRPPRRPDAPLFTRGLVLWALMQGALVLVLVGAIYALALARGVPEDEARTLAFTSLAATNAGLVLVNRSFSASIANAFRLTNRALWAVAGGTATILALAINVPALSGIFRFGTLHVHDLAIALGCAAGLIVMLEAGKRLLAARLAQ